MNIPITQERKGEVLVVKIPEKFTLENSEELREFMKAQVRKGKFKWVFDVRQTRVVDSSGLAAIVSQIATCRAHKGDVRLARVQKPLRELLEITHLDHVLKTYSSVKEAVDSFQQEK